MMQNLGGEREQLAVRERDGHALRRQLLLRGRVVRRRAARLHHALPRRTGALNSLY